MKNDLARWVLMLEERKLTTAEFELLVKSYKTQIAMNGLLLAGLSEIRATEFGVGVLNIVTDVALNLVEKQQANYYHQQYNLKPDRTGLTK